MVLVVDNYDSFTYNLVEQIRREKEVTIIRNDDAFPEKLWPKIQGILISPGPGTPEDAGISTSVINKAIGSIPVLGVCLGHQLLGELFGANIIKGLLPMHGKTSQMIHDQSGVFSGLPSPTKVMRYHSLIIDPEGLPNELTITARTLKGEIMGIRHKFYNLAGVQFHPESILTEHGDQMISNWIQSLTTPNIHPDGT